LKRWKGLTGYAAYLPGITTVVGGVMVAIGLFFGQSQPTNSAFQWLRLGGAIVAAAGALWSGHRQIQSGVANKERDQKIIDLTEQLHGQVTGGDSFCYARPVLHLAGATQFHWMFVHVGRYPLFDVSVRIVNLDRPAHQVDLGLNRALGTLFPGRAHGPMLAQTRVPLHSYNLFFVARNGAWTQEIRWVDLREGGLAIVDRVRREGAPADQPVHLEMSPEFPRDAKGQVDWDHLPGRNSIADPLTSPQAPPHGHFGTTLSP
jgi:hypothetical protein